MTEGKEIYMRAASVFAMFLLLILAVRTSAQTNQSEQIPALSYDALMRNKDAYLGKTVRVKSFWIYGFEWSFFCGASDCQSRKSETWVEFIDEDDLCKGSKGKLKKGSGKYFDNKAEVVFVGKLLSGRFGHMSAYDYQFTVGCVEKLKKLKVD